MNTIYKNILLTGEPGVGKTTIIKAVLKMLPVAAQGFYTEEITAGKTRKGFHLISTSGEQLVIAHVNKKSTYRVGKYGVDVKLFEEAGVPLLEKALKDRAPLIVIDEIGKMECYSKNFRDQTLRCLDSPIPVLGTIQNFASPVINTILNREDVVVISVTMENRDLLPLKIAELLKRLLKPEDSDAAKGKKRKR